MPPKSIDHKGVGESGKVKGVASEQVPWWGFKQGVRFKGCVEEGILTGDTTCKSVTGSICLRLFVCLFFSLGFSKNWEMVPYCFPKPVLWELNTNNYCSTVDFTNTIHLTSTLVVETSVTNNSSFQNYSDLVITQDKLLNSFQMKMYFLLFQYMCMPAGHVSENALYLTR